MQHTSLDALATFAAVARAGSVTGGADELGLTQSTVSAQVQALERELGTGCSSAVPGGFP